MNADDIFDLLDKEIDEEDFQEKFNYITKSVFRIIDFLKFSDAPRELFENILSKKLKDELTDEDWELFEEMKEDYGKYTMYHVAFLRTCKILNKARKMLTNEQYNELFKDYKNVIDYKKIDGSKELEEKINDDINSFENQLKLMGVTRELTTLLKMVGDSKTEEEKELLKAKPASNLMN